MAGGMAVLLAGHDPRPQAASCGLVTCHASLPSTAFFPELPSPHATSPVRAAGHRQQPPSAVPLITRTQSPTPSSPRRPSPSPSPTVTVTFALDQQWPSGFQGQFTIANNGTTPLSGWTLVASLPGDRVRSVWNASYQTSGDTLTLTPPSYEPAIAPGGTLSAFFTASGTTASPASCTFNGQPCG